MGETTDQVRRDIERTRAEMSQTIDEIGDRMSPRRMVQRRTERVRSAFRGLRDNVMGTADYGMQTAGQTLSDVRAGASDAASSAVDTLTSAPDIARRQVAGSPLAAGLVAFGGGLLLASVLPTTDTEEQMATSIAPALEPVKSQAKQVGQHMAEGVRGDASEAADELRQRASQAAQTVKQQASVATQDISQEASSAGGDVKETASSSGRRVVRRARTGPEDVS